MTYRVVRYDADGCHGPRVGEVLASGLTLEAAHRVADHGHGSWYPPGDGEVIAYHGSGRNWIGGYVVVEEPAP